MVAKRHDIGARGADLLIVLLGEAAAMAGVFAIHHHEVETVAGLQFGETKGKSIAAGSTHHVAEKQQSHEKRLSEQGRRLN